MDAGKPRLLDEVRGKIRLKHYSIRTETAYVDWIRRFIRFHDRQHPNTLGSTHVAAFLTHLAVAGRVAASTQNQARSALLFLYKEVLEIELPRLDDVVSAKTPRRLPVVLTEEEVKHILVRIDGTPGLMLRLIYGSGMRIMECMRLRVKDIDFIRHEILVREGKGNKDRVTMLPVSLVPSLKQHLQRVQALHGQDLRDGFGEVYLPFALARKYPNAGREWVGSMSSRPPNVPPIRVPARSVAIMPMRKRCSARCSRRSGTQALPSPLRRIHCVIPSPRICCRRGTISVPCRNCWAIRMSAPP